MKLGPLGTDLDSGLGCLDRETVVSDRHVTLAQLQPRHCAAVESYQLLENRDGGRELFPGDQSVGDDSQGVDAVLLGELGVGVECTPCQFSGSPGIDRLSQVGQCRQELRIIEARLVGLLKQSVSSKPKRRDELRVGLLAGELAIGEPEAAILVGRGQVVEVVEGDEIPWRESPACVPGIVSPGGVNPDAVMSRCHVRDLGGRLRHVAGDTPILDPLSACPVCRESALGWLVARDAMGSEGICSCSGATR